MATLINTLTQPTTNSIIFTNLAQTSSYYYGEGNYNNTTYNGQTAGTNGLINSGTVAGFAILVGSIIIITAILVKAWKRPKKSINTNKAK